MSKNIFKTATTVKNSSNKSNNNRFSSLKDELNEKSIENNTIPKEVKEKEKPKSRFNFDDDEVNVFKVENTEDKIDTKIIQNTAHIQSHNSFTTIKTQVIKPVEEEVKFVYNEDFFPELTTIKKNNDKKTSYVDKMKINNPDTSLVEKLKLKYKEDIEENKKKQEEKRLEEEKNYIEPGWVCFRRDPITKRMNPYYGDNNPIVVKEKTLSEHVNNWIDGVEDRYLRRKELLENKYGINNDYSYEENYAEYFDMLDAKEEYENAKEEERILNSYLNEEEEDEIDSYESYSYDYWKKR